MRRGPALASAPTGLRLVVTSARRPCSRVDERFGKTWGAAGVRAVCARTGLAGVLLRVASPGTVAVGDALTVAARPNPAWPVLRAASLLYGHPDAAVAYARRNVRRAEWLGTDAELRELAALPELAELEHRDQLRAMLAEPEAAATAAPLVAAS